MCHCQVYGKSGVPNDHGRCLVCGEVVDPQAQPLLDQLLAELGASAALGELQADRCRHCDRLIGIGHPAFHLRICDDCRETHPEETIQ